MVVGGGGGSRGSSGSSGFSGGSGGNGGAGGWWWVVVGGGGGSGPSNPSRKFFCCPSNPSRKKCMSDAPNTHFDFAGRTLSQDSPARSRKNCTETQVSYCHTPSRAPLQRNVHFIIVSSFCFSNVQRFSST